MEFKPKPVCYIFLHVDPLVLFYLKGTPFFELDMNGGSSLTSREQSVHEIRQQVRKEIATQLFDLLPVPTIARVCNLTVEQVVALVRQSESGGNVAREQSVRRTTRTIELLDQPLTRLTVPLANSTKRAIERNKEVSAKLKGYL